MSTESGMVLTWPPTTADRHHKTSPVALIAFGHKTADRIHRKNVYLDKQTRPSLCKPTRRQRRRRARDRGRTTRCATLKPSRELRATPKRALSSTLHAEPVRPCVVFGFTLSAVIIQMQFHLRLPRGQSNIHKHVLR